MPRKLSLGAGIAQGVTAFVQSFTQAKQYEQQEKMQKNAFIVNLLTRQLEDENLPYFEKAKILDSIPQLIGAKTQRPLSSILGWDQLNEQEVETKAATKGTPGTPAKSLSSEQTGSQFEGQTLDLKGTEATSDIPAEFQKRGNLTPAQIRQKLVLAQKAAEDEGDIKKQSKILELNYNLQKNILGKGGYTERLPHTFDQDKNLIIRFMRPQDGDIISKNLGKVTTEALEKAGLTAGQPKGKLGQLMQARQIMDAYEKDPTSYTSSQYSAAKSLVDDFERTGQLKEAQTTAIELGNTGLKPATASAKMANEDRDRGVSIQIQTDIDNNRAEAEAAMGEVQRLGTLKTAKANEVTQLKQQLANSEFSPDDDAYKDLQRRIADANNEYNALEKQFGDQVRRETLARTKLTGAEGRLRSVGSGGSGVGPIAKAFIDKYFGGDVAKAQTAYQQKFGKPLDLSK